MTKPEICLACFFFFALGFTLRGDMIYSKMFNQTVLTLPEIKK